MVKWAPHEARGEWYMDETFYFPRIWNTMKMAECSFSIISLFISLNGWFFDGDFGIYLMWDQKMTLNLDQDYYKKRKEKRKKLYLDLIFWIPGPTT